MNQIATLDVDVRSGPATIIDKGLAIFRRDAKLAVSYEVQFALRWFQVIAGVLVSYFLATLIPPSPKFGLNGATAGYFTYTVINVAFVTLQSTALSTFSQVVRDGQLQGTLEVVLSTPTPLSVIVLSSALWTFTLTLFQAGIELGIGAALGLNLTHTNLLTFFVFLFLTFLSITPLGVLSAAFTMIFKQLGPFDAILTPLSFLAGGVYIPVVNLPHALQIVGWLLPITHSLAGLRGAVYGGSLVDLGPDLLWLVLASALLFPLSIVVFNWAVHLARTDGTLGQY